MSSKNDLAYEGIRLLWRNYPTFPSTFSTCPNKKCISGLGGRGGGLCAICAEAMLAEAVGPDMAKNFSNAIHKVRTLEHEIREKISGRS